MSTKKRELFPGLTPRKYLGRINREYARLKEVYQKFCAEEPFWKRCEHQNTELRSIRSFYIRHLRYVQAAEASLGQTPEVADFLRHHSQEYFDISKLYNDETYRIFHTWMLEARLVHYIITTNLKQYLE